MNADALEALRIDEQFKLPQTPATRLTRRQLAKLEEEEALGKSQRAPSGPESNATEDAAEHTTEQIEASVEDRTNDAPVQNETKIAQAQHTQTKPGLASGPARRTRRQQTKLEQEHSSIQAIDIGELTATEESNQATSNEVTGHDVRTTAHNNPTEGGSASASKPNRLTRHQQEKLEEEQHRLGTEHQTPRSEPTEGKELDGISTEAPTGSLAEHMQEGSDEAISKQTNDIEEHTTPADIEETHLDDSETVTAGHLGAVENVKSPLSAESQNGDAQMAVEARPTTPTDAEFDAEFEPQIDGPLTNGVPPLVNITSEAEPKMLCGEKPFETSVSTPNEDQRASRRTSRSPSKSPMRIEESISAIDRLEEDLESVGKAIPDFDQSDDEMSPRESVATCDKTPTKTPMITSAPLPARGVTKLASKTSSKTSSKTPTEVPVTKKAPLHAKISRVPDAARKSVKPTTTSLARASSVRTAPRKDVGKPSSEPADYLASKRRPISLSFPTPPPPPKGRAPTKPVFQLSSDNVAAKLKAQKEERLKREAGRTTAPTQRPISMPPPPKSTKPPTVPTFQLSGEATAARLKAQKEARLKRMEEAEGEKPVVRPISMSAAPKSTKPVTRPNFQLPGEATAARLKAQKEERMKRMEEAEAAKKLALTAPVRKPIVHRPRDSLLAKDTSGVTIPPTPQTKPSQPSTSLTSKRSSVVEPSASRSTSTSSSKRRSVLLAEGGKSTVTPTDAASLKMKGKQVFNRDKMEKEAMERERKEKEEAAKRARAEAAERGRIASREWAERQQKKMMMMGQ